MDSNMTIIKKIGYIIDVENSFNIDLEKIPSWNFCNQVYLSKEHLRQILDDEIIIVVISPIDDVEHVNSDIIFKEKRNNMKLFNTIQVALPTKTFLKYKLKTNKLTSFKVEI